MCCVESGQRVELGECSGPADEVPVHVDSYAGDLRERLAVRTCKGFKGRCGDFGSPVASI